MLMLKCLFVVFVLADIFDHRNGSMIRQWFIDEFVAGEDGIDSPYIDGFCKPIGIYPYSVSCQLAARLTQRPSWRAVRHCSLLALVFSDRNDSFDAAMPVQSLTTTGGGRGLARWTCTTSRTPG
jgi:hypothetical protein